MGKFREEYKPSVNELITLRQASEFSGLTASHLRRLLGNQKVWGKILRVLGSPLNML